MPYVTLPQRPGSLIFALRRDEKHYQHLEKVTKCSFMIYPLTPAHIKPKDLPLPKVNLTGVALSLDDPSDVDTAMERFGTAQEPIFGLTRVIPRGTSNSFWFLFSLQPLCIPALRDS